MKIRNNKAKIDISLLHSLVKIGLTQQEATIYVLLVNEGTLPAREIASRLQILPHAIYRVIKKLNEKQLITIINYVPLKYTILPPELALSTYIKNQAQDLEKTVVGISESFAKKRSFHSPTKINIQGGKQNLFIWSKDLINHAKNEVLIISIGEPSDPDLILANRRAIERGVLIRMIIHKYDKENQEFIQNLEKNGLKIRHFPDWGFHIVISDQENLLLSVNDPKNPTERITIKFVSPGLTKALRDYFNSVWEKAVIV